MPAPAGRRAAPAAGQSGSGKRRPAKLPKTFTAAEIEALFAVPNLHAPTGLRNRAMLELMHRAGTRVSETCGLHVRDVDWRAGELHLRPEITKGAVEAVLPLDDRTIGWLERWKHERRRYAAGKPHLFTTLKGGPVGRIYVWQMMNRYARRAGIERDEPIGPHMLRHTFATDLLREGFDLRSIQTLLRHADVRTTTIYTHIHHGELADKIRRRP